MTAKKKSRNWSAPARLGLCLGCLRPISRGLVSCLAEFYGDKWASAYVSPRAAWPPFRTVPIACGAECLIAAYECGRLP